MQSSLPAGWLAFTGRELNPLDRYKRFQITFSFPLFWIYPGARRTILHLSYSYAAPCGPALLVTRGPSRNPRSAVPAAAFWGSAVADGYALRRRSAARTRARNCSGVSVRSSRNRTLRISADRPRGASARVAGIQSEPPSRQVLQLASPGWTVHFDPRERPRPWASIALSYRRLAGTPL
jgi:hypothetical protein